MQTFGAKRCKAHAFINGDAGVGFDFALFNDDSDLVSTTTFTSQTGIFKN